MTDEYAASSETQGSEHGAEAGPPIDAPDDRIIEISQLAGGLAHEIRNPLSTLLLNLKLLEEDLGEGLDEDADVLRRGKLRIRAARTEAERLQRMLDDFLRLVRPVGLHRKLRDLNDVVQPIIRFFTPEAEKHAIGVEMELAADSLPVNVDAPAIEQVVLNLLLNAQEAMKSGGRISVRTRRGGSMAVLEICDTGDGIPTDIAPKVFQAFYSTKPSGSGLGLSSVRRIVRLHEGEIDFRTAAERGTCFEMQLPLAPAAATDGSDARAS